MNETSAVHSLPRTQFQYLSFDFTLETRPHPVSTNFSGLLHISPSSMTLTRGDAHPRPTGKTEGNAPYDCSVIIGNVFSPSRRTPECARIDDLRRFGWCT